MFLLLIWAAWDRDWTKDEWKAEMAKVDENTPPPTAAQHIIALCPECSIEIYATKDGAPWSVLARPKMQGPPRGNAPTA
jgi:hypothetical protein